MAHWWLFIAAWTGCTTGVLIMLMCAASSEKQEENEKLKYALEFYANKENHEQYYIGNGEPAILEDAGKIARVALGQEVVKC